MKILQIIHAFPPQSIGGSEIYTRNLALALAKKGAEVLVLTRVNNPAQKEYLTSSHSDDGFQVFAINNTFKYCTSFELTYKNQIINGIYAKLIDNWKPDLVHFEHLTCLSTTLVKETSRRKIPTVFTLHDYWLICQRGQLLKKDLSLCEGPNRENCYACLGEQLILGKSTKLLSTKIQKYNYFKKVLAKGAPVFNRFFLPLRVSRLMEERKNHILELFDLVDLFISPSRFLRQKFIQFGIHPEKIVYSDNGFDPSPFAGLKREQSKHLRLGFVGALIPSKGIHILIEAFNRLREAPAELKIFGDFVPYHGDQGYSSELRKLGENPRIKFMGGFPPERVGEIFSEIDVLITPSIWMENSPLVIHEASLAQVPVIASRIGGIPELIEDGKNGLLFEPNNALDLQKKIELLLNRPETLSRLRAYPAQIKTIEQNAQELEEIYARLIANRS